MAEHCMFYSFITLVVALKCDNMGEEFLAVIFFLNCLMDRADMTPTDFPACMELLHLAVGQ